MKKNTGKVVAMVPSESSAKMYKVVRTDLGGHLMCSCMAFRFAKGEIGSPSKTCKHLKSIAA